MPPDLRLRSTEPEIRIAQIGALTERKGGRLAIEALERLREARVDAELLFIGSGPSRGGWEEFASSRGLQSKVRFLGSRNDVGDIISACDVLVLPSTLEGMPLTLIEGMARGRPFVASAIDGIPSLAEGGDSGLLFEPGNLTGFVEQLERISRDAELRRRLGTLGRRRFETRHTVERMCHRTFELYREGS
jgi:glycosyltransferase involved in cell wall biosynthesis